MALQQLLFGVHENDDPAATVERLGGNATRRFTPGVIGPRDLVREVEAKCGPTWAAGHTAVWSFKPDPEAVRDGSWKSPVQRLAAYLRDNPDKKTLVIIWHEPENDAPRYFRDGRAFVTMFNTVADWFRAVHPDITLIHAALAYRYGDNIKGGITDEVAPTWRTNANIHALDAYSGRTNPLDTILPQLSSYVRWKRYVARDDEWGCTERGWTLGATPTATSSATRAATMAREGVWLATLPPPKLPKIYLIWNTEGAEGDPGLVLDNAGEQAARIITGQYAAAAGRTTPALPPAGGVGAAPLIPMTYTTACPLCKGAGKYTFTVDKATGA